MTDRKLLLSSLRPLLGPGVGAGISDPKAPDGNIWPQEASAIEKAVPKRRLEFTAGRVAARLAMADLGLETTPIPMAPDRAPVWPDGLVGSIAHCHTSAIAAVAPKGALQSIGIDIEEAEDLAKDLWETVCTDTELAWLETLPPYARGRIAKQIFTAKEAVYKAQYPLTQEIIGFEAVRITLHSPTMFTAHTKQHTYFGQWAIVSGLILCAVPVRLNSLKSGT
ncbi:MAG: 4'-phosphopantetheinyl transferase superfamily protein [Paracoccaceae bacterium]